MAKVILGLTVSLDGFAEDIKGSVGKLYPDRDTLRETEVLKESISSTGSVVMSKKNLLWQKTRIGWQIIMSTRCQYLFLQIKHLKSIRRKIQLNSIYYHFYRNNPKKI